MIKIVCHALAVSCNIQDVTNEIEFEYIYYDVLWMLYHILTDAMATPVNRCLSININFRLEGLFLVKLSNNRTIKY
jgi:hypothetical protein